MKVFIILFFFASHYGFTQTDEDGFTSQDYVWMGDKACEDDNWIDGISFYKKAIFLDSNNVQANVQIARALHHVNQDDVETPLAYSLRAILLDSNNAKAHEYTAVLYGIDEKYDEAEYHLLKIMTIDEKSPISYYGLARIKTVRQDFDAALIYARKALQLFESTQATETGDAQYLTGVIQFYKGNYNEARSLFITARKNGIIWDNEIKEFMLQDKKILLTPESYKATENELFVSLDYLLNFTAFEEDENRKKASQFIFEWIGGAPHVDVLVTDKLVPYVTYGEAFVVYLASNARFQIEHPSETDAWKAPLVATQTVIQYYQNNKGYYGKSREIYRLLKLQRQNKLVDFVKSNYR